MQVTTVGLDLAKHVFQVHGIDQDGQVLIRRRALHAISGLRFIHGLIFGHGFMYGKENRDREFDPARVLLRQFAGDVGTDNGNSGFPFQIA